MKTHYLGAEHARELILCFLGWDTTPAVAEHLKRDERAVLFCSDYREPAPLSISPTVEKIYLVAWSLGVWAAEEIAAHLPLTQAVAINGTPRPISEEYGIPPAIFRGTREGLTPKTREKFAHRLCFSPAEWEKYQTFPQRDFAAVQAELTALEERITTAPKRENILWQKAFIGTEDRIFPPAAQQRYWQEKGHLFQGGHNLFPHLHTWAQLFDEP